MSISHNGSLAAGISGVEESSSRSGRLFPLASPAPSPQNAAASIYLSLGRLFLGSSLFVFGVQEFRYSGHVPDLGLVPGWFPLHLLAAWCAGALFLLVAFAILLWIRVRLAALVLSAALVVAAFLRVPPSYATMIQSVPARTVFFELLSCAAGCWMLTAFFTEPEPLGPSVSLTARLAITGRWVFAFASIVYGIGHFQAPTFIASVIPAWIPFHLFWAWFTGVAFVLAGLAMATRIGIRPAAGLLALMFFLWVVLLHAPRIAHAVHNGDEWNSGFVALAMSGCALLVAARPSGRQSATSSPFRA